MKQIFGFSLIELLISLIAISVIVAAFAPIATSKLKHREISKTISVNCTKFDSECLVCNKSSCTICKNFMNTPDGFYINPEEGCDYKSCSAKFGEGCQSCSKDYCQSCKSGYGFNPAEKTNPQACKICDKGTISTGGKNACVDCNPGQYQDEIGKSTCKNCSAGQYSDAKAIDCINCNSVFGNCANCSAQGCINCAGSGYYYDETLAKCVQKTCPKGYKLNDSSCVLCENGYIQPNDNSTAASCSPCGINQTNNSNHSACVSTCAVASSCTGNTALVDGCHCSDCGSNIPSADRKSCISNAVICSGSTYLDSSTNTCKDCPIGCSLCSDLNTCTECKDGYQKDGNVCKDSSACPGWGIKISLSGNNYCFTKLNIGDDATVNTMIGLVSDTSTSGFSYGKYNGNAGRCWRPVETADTAAYPANNPGFNYSSRNRTVCTWYAAKHACEQLAAVTGQPWDLLPEAVAKNMITKIASEPKTCTGTPASGSIQRCAGAKGLQLCHGSNVNYGSPICKPHSYNCVGAAGGNGKTCRPQDIWLDKQFWVYELTGEKGGMTASQHDGRGAGVRCVLELI